MASYKGHGFFVELISYFLGAGHMLNRAIRSTQPVHLNIMELYLNMGGVIMRFYTIKLPKFLGGLIRAILGGGKR